MTRDNPAADFVQNNQVPASNSSMARGITSRSSHSQSRNNPRECIRNSRWVASARQNQPVKIASRKPPSGSNTSVGTRSIQVTRETSKSRNSAPGAKAGDDQAAAAPEKRKDEKNSRAPFEGEGLFHRGHQRLKQTEQCRHGCRCQKKKERDGKQSTFRQLGKSDGERFEDQARPACRVALQGEDPGKNHQPGEQRNRSIGKHKHQGHAGYGDLA